MSHFSDKPSNHLKISDWQKITKCTYFTVFGVSWFIRLTDNFVQKFQFIFMDQTHSQTPAGWVRSWSQIAVSSYQESSSTPTWRWVARSNKAWSCVLNAVRIWSISWQAQKTHTALNWTAVDSSAELNMCICGAFRSFGVYGVEYWTRLGGSVDVEGIQSWWRNTLAKNTLWRINVKHFFLYFFVHLSQEACLIAALPKEAQIHDDCITPRDSMKKRLNETYFIFTTVSPWLGMTLRM